MADEVEALRGARERGMPWLEVVRAVRRLKERGSADALGRTWTSVAAEASGCSMNELNQWERTLAAMEALCGGPGAPDLDEVLGKPVNGLEVVSRIAKLDAAAAVALLRGEHTVRDLRARYHELADRPGAGINRQMAGHRRRRAVAGMGGAIVSEPGAAARLVGAGPGADLRVFAWPGGFPYASPDLAVVVAEGGPAKIHAVRFVELVADLNGEAALKAVKRAAIEASFFDGYHLVVAEGDASELRRHADALGLWTVGIAEVRDGGLHHVATARGADPAPDHRGLLLARLPALREFAEALAHRSDLKRRDREIDALPRRGRRRGDGPAQTEAEIEAEAVAACRFPRR